MTKKIDKFVDHIFSSKKERLSLITKLEKAQKGLVIVLAILGVLCIIQVIYVRSNTSSVVLCLIAVSYAMNSSMLYLTKVVDRFKDELEDLKNDTKQ